MRRALHGHAWTLAPHLAHVLRPERGPGDRPWATTLQDPDVGPVRLTGSIHHHPGADALVLLVHGLGGSADSRYLLRMARACEAAGLSYLRLSLRGADLCGADLYHAGMSADLEAALASPELARYARLYVVGYSLGGHITLTWASRPGRDPRVNAIAAVCAPLDLRFGARAIQRPSGVPYQWYVLGRLKEAYRAFAARRGLPLGPVLAARTILEWDERVVVPRFGFASPDDYYARTSVGPSLPRVAVPALYVAAEADPMVTPAQLRPWLADAPPGLKVAFSARGGHVAFPADLDLGLGEVAPLEGQVARWLARHA